MLNINQLIPDNNTKNKINLYDFLNKYRIEKGKNIKPSHVSMGNFVGSYSIPKENIDEFMKLYKKQIKKEIPSILEMHEIQGPIIIDIDLKYTIKKDNLDNLDNYRKYLESDIINIIKNYNYILLTYLKLTDSDMHAYVLEKNKPKIISKNDIEEKYKDGFHIIYPNICTIPIVQYFFRELIIMKFKEDKLLEHLNLDNTIEDIFDRSIIEKNGWLLYGSSKDNLKDSLYVLTKVYDYNLGNIIDELEEDDDFRRDLPDVLSIKKYNENMCTEFKDNITLEIIESKLDSIMIKTNKRIYTSNSEIYKARQLLNLLSLNRAKDYNKWIELGFCLHNIDDSLLEDWIEFSKNDMKLFKEGECDKLWSKFRYEGLNIGSLYRWAREDNFEGYSNFLFDELSDIIKKSLDATSYNIAKVFYEFNKYQYVCVDIKNKKWYEFVDHRWIPMYEATGIINKLNTELSDQYIKLSIAYNLKSLNIKLDEGEKRKYREKGEQANKIAKLLNGMAFKKDIISELLHLYFKRDFLDKLDDNNDLIGFNNGIYDLKNEYFRNGRPEDYISFSTNTNYIKYDPNNINIKAVINFFEQIQPENDLREYLLRKLSTCLEGHIRYQHFEVWTGVGSNGKGRILKLLLDSFGDYGCTLPVSFLTKKGGDSENASPCLSKTKGKRVAVFQEPEYEDCIYVGKLKSLTGSDKIMSRNLYSEPQQFYIKWKGILAANKLPGLSGSDPAVFRRIRVLPFEIKFVNNPIESNEKQIIYNLDDMMNNWHEAFLSLLIETYKKYIKYGIDEPSKVLLNTNLYQSAADCYSAFIKEKLIITNNPKDKILASDLFTDFKFWLKDYNLNEFKNLKKSDFKYEMDQRLKSTNLYYKCIIYNINELKNNDYDDY